ncbi:MAG: hypothetical protein ABFQ95_07740 [Pseudomonadota bacterium]
MVEQKDRVEQASNNSGAQNQKTAIVDEDISNSNKVQRQLSLLFFVVVFVGLVGAMLHQWWFPPLCVVFYFLIGLFLSKKVLNTGKLADGVYYMGFLFTLWALFIAFVPWGKISGELSADIIITQFGIALLTTVLGITFRLFLIQSQVTLSDQEIEARESIATGIAKMNKELSEAANDLARTRKSLCEESENVLAQIRKIVLEEVRSVSGELLKTQASYTSTVGEQTHSLSKMVSEMRTLIECFEIISKESDKHMESYQLVAQNFDKIHTNVKNVTKDFEKLKSNLTTTIVQIKNAGNDVEAYDRLVGVSHLLTSAVKKLNDNVVYYEGAMKESIQLVNDLLSDSLKESTYD